MLVTLLTLLQVLSLIEEMEREGALIDQNIIFAKVCARVAIAPFHPHTHSCTSDGLRVLPLGRSSLPEEAP